MTTFRIIDGDARTQLAGLEPGSVQTCVTSPPYWGLRDYKMAGQLGLETTPESYIEAMGDIFDEVRRVLRPDGTLWVNMGDSYANVGKFGGSSGGKHAAGLHGNSGVGRGKRDYGNLKGKDLVGIPWMLAFELRRRGWFLRQDIIWSKPNPMPESVTDRCTKAHEYLFMLSKSSRYYFDQDAIKEPAVDSEGRGGGAQHSEGRGPTDQREAAGPTERAGTSGTSEDRQAGGPRETTRRIQRALEIEGGGGKVPSGWDTSRGRGGHGSFHRDGRVQAAPAGPGQHQAGQDEAPPERKARWLRCENQCAARARGLPGGHRLAQ